MSEIIQGKVKTLFETEDPNVVLIQYEDKVTAGNGRSVDFPEDKGEICCKISECLFQLMELNNIDTHYMSIVPRAIMVCKRVEIIPIEVIVRNIAAGSIVRQTTLEEGTVLPEPLVEWYLKDDAKDDPLLTEDRIALMGDYNLLILKDLALTINAILRETFLEIGLTLVDFKLEFGYDVNKNILLADELSPDGMRLWKEGKSFDKDLFRKGQGNIVDAYRYILEKLNE